MSLHASDDAWHASHGLEEDRSIEPGPLVHLLWVVVGDEIHALTSTQDHEVSDLVLYTNRVPVCVLDPLDVLLRVDRMRHPVTLWVHHHLVLW